MMNQLPYILQPAARKQPRYSIRPFYTSLILFSVLATASWFLKSTAKEHGQFTQGAAAGISLFKREGEPEVPTPHLPCEMCER
jgi:sodium/potassium/calcium exchanger 6